MKKVNYIIMIIKNILKKKIYRELNKDKIKEQNSEVIKCLCGSSFTKKSKARHKKP